MGCGSYSDESGSSKVPLPGKRIFAVFLRCRRGKTRYEEMEETVEQFKASDNRKSCKSRGRMMARDVGIDIAVKRDRSDLVLVRPGLSDASRE
jgi:hypothetical protein